MKIQNPVVAGDHSFAKRLFCHIEMSSILEEHVPPLYNTKLIVNIFTSLCLF